MFKVTFILSINQKELGKRLEVLKFHRVKDNLVWELDGYKFSVCPFVVNGRESRGYRVLFNGSHESGM
jgi:hypothetical protein